MSAMSGLLRKFRETEDGQSLVEFAIVAPFLLVLLTACVDYGRYMYDGILIGNAARAGVQYGSESQNSAADYSGMRSAAIGDATTLGLTAVATSCTCGNNAANTCPPPNPPTTPTYICPADYTALFVQVTVSNTIPFQPLISLPGLTNSLTITRTAVAQVSP